MNKMNKTDILIELVHWLKGKKEPFTDEFVVRFEETDKALDLPPGSTEEYLEVATREAGLEIAQRGATRVCVKNPSGYSF